MAEIDAAGYDAQSDRQSRIPLSLRAARRAGAFDAPPARVRESRRRARPQLAVSTRTRVRAMPHGGCACSACSSCSIPTGARGSASSAGAFSIRSRRRARIAATTPEGTTLVALSHLGLRADRRLAQAVPRLDLILGGHSHDTLPEPDMSAGVPIVHAGPYGALRVAHGTRARRCDRARARRPLRSASARRVARVQVLRLLFVANGHGETAIAARIARRRRARAERPVGLDLFPLVGDGRGRRAARRRRAARARCRAAASSRWGTSARSQRDVRAGFAGLFVRAGRIRTGGARAQYDMRRRRRRRLRARDSRCWPRGAPSSSARRRACTSRHTVRSSARSCGAPPGCSCATCRRPSALRAQGVPAEAPGNVIVDLRATWSVRPRGTWLGLFPGSRMEAYRDGVRLARVARALATVAAGRRRAVCPSRRPSTRAGSPGRWPGTAGCSNPAERRRAVFARSGRPRCGRGRVRSGRSSARSVAVLGQAGTANEQAAAFGVPVLALGSERARARRLVPHASAAAPGRRARDRTPRNRTRAAAAIDALLGDAARLGRMRRAGPERMGPPGGAAAIAARDPRGGRMTARDRSWRRRSRRSSSSCSSTRRSPRSRRRRPSATCSRAPPSRPRSSACSRSPRSCAGSVCWRDRAAPAAASRRLLAAWIGSAACSGLLGFDPLSSVQIVGIMLLTGLFHVALVRYEREPGVAAWVVGAYLVAGARGVARGAADVALRTPAALWALNHGRAAGVFVTANQFAAYLVAFIFVAVGAALGAGRRAPAPRGRRGGDRRSRRSRRRSRSRAGSARRWAACYLAFALGARRVAAAMLVLGAVAALVVALRPAAGHNPAEAFDRLRIWRAGRARRRTLSAYGRRPDGVLARLCGDSAAQRRRAGHVRRAPSARRVSVARAARRASLGLAALRATGGGNSRARCAPACGSHRRSGAASRSAPAPALVAVLVQGVFDTIGIVAMAFVWIPYTALALAAAARGPPHARRRRVKVRRAAAALALALAARRRAAAARPSGSRGTRRVRRPRPQRRPRRRSRVAGHRRPDHRDVEQERHEVHRADRAQARSHVVRAAGRFGSGPHISARIRATARS